MTVKDVLKALFGDPPGGRKRKRLEAVAAPPPKRPRLSPAEAVAPAAGEPAGVEPAAAAAPVCAWPGCIAAAPRKCSSCMRVSYCGAEHAQKHWEARHKHECSAGWAHATGVDRIPGVWQYVDLRQELKGVTVGVDLSNVLHEPDFVGSHGAAILRGHYDEALNDLRTRAMAFCSLGTNLIFVADPRNVHTEAKAYVAAQRATSRAEYLATFDSLGAAVTPSVIAGAYRITEAFQQRAISCLVVAGFSVITAPFEAEHQLVQMWHDGEVDCVWCRDGDVFVLGAVRVIWHGKFFTSWYATVVNLSYAAAFGGRSPDLDFAVALAASSSDQDRAVGRMFLRFYAILAGCDYCDIHGCGRVHAARLTRDLFFRNLHDGSDSYIAFTPARVPELLEALLEGLITTVPDVKTAITVGGGVIVHGVKCNKDALRLCLRRGYYAYAAAVVYSFLRGAFVHMDAAPPPDLHKFIYGCPAGDFWPALHERQKRFDAEFGNNSVTPMNLPFSSGTTYRLRFPAAASGITGMPIRSQRYEWSMPYAMQIVRHYGRKEAQSKCAKAAENWLALTRSVASGAVNEDQAGRRRNLVADWCVLLQRRVHEERMTMPRRTPVIRPPDWAPAAGTLVGGPRPSAAQRRDMLERVLTNTPRPAMYRPGSAILLAGGKTMPKFAPKPHAARYKFTMEVPAEPRLDTAAST